MINFYKSTVLFCFSIFLSTIKSEELLPFATYNGNSPGATYDLGILASTDIIKVESSWIARVDYGNPVRLQLWSISGGAAITIPIFGSYMVRPTSTNFIY